MKCHTNFLVAAVSIYCSPVIVIWEVSNGNLLAAVHSSCFVITDSVDYLQYDAEIV